jgi:hypothetical protein
MHCHCDASYGVHCDGRSHTGYVFSYGDTNSFLHARSYKQKLTAISSTDAEILAACSATQTAIWLRNLHNEIMAHIGQSLESIILHQDNKSAIWLYKEPTRYRRSKHILTKVAFVRDNVATGVVTVDYLETDELQADMLTKPLQGEPFIKHAHKIMG